MKRSMKLISLFLVMVFAIGVMLPVNVAAKEYTIKDVQKTDEAYQNVQDVINQGWMSLTLGKFFPDKYISREEFSLVLTKFNGQLSEAAKIKKVTFKDIKLKDTFSKYIELQKPYITYYKGKDGIYFKPKNYLSREDALVAIVKMLGYDTDSAIEEGSDSEVDINEIIEDANKISPALKSFVTTGVVNELIDLKEVEGLSYLYPKSNITRRQLAQLLTNAKSAKEMNKLDITTDDSDDSSDATIDSGNSNNTTDKSSKNDTTSNKNGTNNKSADKKSDASTDGMMGYLKIEVNGEKRIYEQAEYTSLVPLRLQRYVKDKNSFYFGIPNDVRKGDTLIIDTISKSNDGFNPLMIWYQNNNGQYYYFNWIEEPDPHKGAKATMEITSNDGTYVTGTFTAELRLTDDSVVTFTNGEFKVKQYVAKKQSTGF